MDDLLAALLEIRTNEEVAAWLIAPCAALGDEIPFDLIRDGDFAPVLDAIGDLIDAA